MRTGHPHQNMTRIGESGLPHLFLFLKCERGICMDIKNERHSLAQIRELDLVAWLETQGFQVAARRKNDTDYWYLSPLREEKTPSFHVSRLTNEWYDFGLMAGGNPVDFFLRYFNCSIPELLGRLDLGSQRHALPLFDDGSHAGPLHKDSRLAVRLAHPIYAYPLKAYLHERSIPLSVAQKFCKEVDFEVNGRSYYGIGFGNDAGGWEIRNKNFKQSSSPKDITTLGCGSKEVKVFEGFFDFLSWQCLNPHTGSSVDFVILNGAGMFDRALPFLTDHQRVGLWLDRDVTGKRYTEYALSMGERFTDESAYFQGYKDLNEWLIHRGQAPKQRLTPQGYPRMRPKNF